MKYMLLICVQESGGPRPPATVAADTDAWVEEMDGRGVRLHGNQLRPVNEATSVRVRDGKRVVTDGPYAEAKEQIAGFDIIECADLDEAIEVAAKHPVAGFGTVEVRPFWEDR